MPKRFNTTSMRSVEAAPAYELQSPLTSSVNFAGHVFQSAHASPAVTGSATDAISDVAGILIQLDKVEPLGWLSCRRKGITGNREAARVFRKR